LVKALLPFHPLIAGDQGWGSLLGKGFRLHRELNYYQELPAFYPVSKISFNATSRQMKDGVNQRVFDVPACRRVVLTDWTRQLEDLMEPGKEVLAYRNREEMVELAGRALADRETLQRVAEAGYHRVLKEHTYRHRLRQLVETMRRTYS
jgi:spore maturation protein CgeB